ncbi:hypothetical protein [Streptomyces chartreusis]|uniref:hypothetical protein n=1 Tax=Streptomyces chartreusis TaxID=1969 RepID=UPI0033FC61B9
MKFYLLRKEPVQEIAAHPDTLALLVAALPKAEHRPGHDRLALLIGLPLTPDPDMPPGFIHCRPFPRPAAPTTAE